jgi:hypothetical protein
VRSRRLRKTVSMHASAHAVTQQGICEPRLAGPPAGVHDGIAELSRLCVAFAVAVAVAATATATAARSTPEQALTEETPPGRAPMQRTIILRAKSGDWCVEHGGSGAE